MLSFPGGCASSGECASRSLSSSLAVARAMLRVYSYSEVESFRGGCVRRMVSVHCGAGVLPWWLRAQQRLVCVLPWRLRAQRLVCIGKGEFLSFLSVAVRAQRSVCVEKLWALPWRLRAQRLVCVEKLAVAVSSAAVSVC
jgi:hypothetical protein